MNSIVILTATYNHPKELMKLFKSLVNQSDKNFTWLIVNDGSGDETEAVLEKIAELSDFDTHIIHQNNGGKSKAINMGMDNLSSNVLFVIIVDDDEYLKRDAIEVIKWYQLKYADSECGVIHFNRMNEKGEIIANPLIDEDYFMSYQKFKSLGRYADGYLGYFLNRLGKERFRIYKGENYIGPSTLFMRVTNSYTLLWAKEVLGETEYLVGGITKQGRRLRINNPLGMIEYCILMQSNGASLKTRFLYSLQGFAYMGFLNPEEKKLVRKKEFISLAKGLGIILTIFWKIKY